MKRKKTIIILSASLVTLLIVVSVVIATVHRVHYIQELRNTGVTDLSTESFSDTDQLGGDDAEITEDSTKQYSVVFHGENSSEVVDTEVVAFGESASIPKYGSIERDDVFLGLNHIPYQISSDMTITPSFKDVSTLTNVFAMDTKYVESQKKLKVTLDLKGLVLIQEADIEIQYNTALLKLIKCDSRVKGLACSTTTDEENQLGIVTAKLQAKNNMEDNTILAELEFNVIGETGMYTELPIVVENAAYAVGDALKETGSAAINGKVYIV